MIPGFMEVIVLPGGSYCCARCIGELWFIGLIGHHHDLPWSKCPQNGMAFELPIQTFPLWKPRTEDPTEE